MDAFNPTGGTSAADSLEQAGEFLADAGEKLDGRTMVATGEHGIKEILDVLDFSDALVGILDGGVKMDDVLKLPNVVVKGTAAVRNIERVKDEIRDLDADEIAIIEQRARDVLEPIVNGLKDLIG